MPKIRECNNEITKLDESFKETLIRVRPYILALTSTEYVQLCKVWLSKLNSATSQRYLRNEYLTELCRQLKTGRICGIFSNPPPEGLLLPLPKSYHMVYMSSTVSDVSDYAVKSHHSCLKPNTKCVHQRRLMKHRMVDMRCLHAMKFSTARLHDQKIQNKYLRNQLCENQENRARKRNVVDYLSSSISRLTTDVSTLKSKLIEMQKLKNCMVESYKEAVQNYHFTVVEQFTELKDELEKAQSKNESLDNRVAMISKKLEEITHGKAEQSKVMERQWMDKLKSICERFDSFTREKNKELQMKQDLLDRKDMELLNKDAGRKVEIELLTNKIQDLENKLEIKIRDEDKIQATIVEQYSLMKQEISKMKIDIDKETEKQNKNLMTQVSALEKAIVKLEKSKNKLEHDYEKKLSQIIKSKDMEIKALQLRLKEQENELYASLSIKKQNEVDNIALILEKRYRMLLAQTEAMSESQIQEYLRKIASLEDQVLSMKKFEPNCIS